MQVIEKNKVKIFIKKYSHDTLRTLFEVDI
jgi:hypothetical protein